MLLWLLALCVAVVGLAGFPATEDLDIPDPLKTGAAAAQPLSCPAGYTLDGSSCTKTVPAAVTTEYMCPAGYRGDGPTCTKTTTETEQASTVTKTSCPVGYSGSRVGCVKTVAATRTFTYSCPAGYRGDGPTCTKTTTETEQASTVTKTSCPVGYSGSRVGCVKTVAATRTFTYSCPAGYRGNGPTCTKTTTVTTSAVAQCPSGYSFIWTVCAKNVTHSRLKRYSCPAGTRLETHFGTRVCVGATNSRPTVTYSCPSGYTDVGSSCVKTLTRAATLVCPSGYALSGSTCSKTTTVTTRSTVKVTYSCSEGRLSGTNCTLTAAGIVTTEYKCRPGWFLSSSTCSKTTTVTTRSTVKVTYSCSEGRLSGTNCTLTAAGIVTTEYKCRPGWFLSSSTCSKTTTVTTRSTVKVTYSCSEGYLSGTNCIITLPATTTTTTTTTAPTTTTTTTTVRPVGRNCTFSLGTLGSLKVTRSGSWAASDRCIASLRGDSQTPYYAKRYEFTLDVHADVTIDLSSSQDAYLYLLEGHGTSASYRARNDDADSTTHDSRLTLGLDAGKYTIDATTFSARSEGSFTLTVATDIVEAAPVTVTGLAGSYNATVGEALDLSISVAPVTAVPSVQSVTPTGLNLELTRNLGTVSISGTPTHAGTYSATFAFVQPGRTDTHSTIIYVACPQDHTQNGDRSCTAPAQPVTVERLAQRYEATVGELFSAGFNYEPDAAQVSVQSVVPSGLSLTLADRSGSAGMAGTPKLAGLYKVTLAFAQPGRTDTEEFTVSASCTEDHVQQSDRSCEPEPVCTIALGRVSSGTLGPKTGSWEDGCALPEGRRGRSGTFYAKHYTFSLNLDAEVTIDLGSGDQDTYLFLLRGHGPDGTQVAKDDDSGPRYDSRLSNLSLPTGDYTISASTYRPLRTGDFKVTVTAVAPASTDLGSSYPVTVGQRLLVEFKIAPAGVAVPTFGPVTTAGLDIEVKRSNYVELDGQPSLSITAHRAGNWKLEMRLIQPGRVDRHPFTVIAKCPSGHTTASDGSCVKSGSRPAVSQSCIGVLISASDPKWGRVTDSGDWEAKCPSIARPSSAAKYYHVSVSTPGRFAGVTLPIKFELTSDPTAAVHIYDGSSPSTASLLRFGSNADSNLASGNIYGLSAGNYLVEIATSDPYDKDGTNQFSLSLQVPPGSEQLRDVQLLGNIGMRGSGMSLPKFLNVHPKVSNILGANLSYLSWDTDGCNGHQYRNPQTNGFPYQSKRLLERFESACMRHDFNWQNLQRIERQVDPSLDTWNTISRTEADRRLFSDLKNVCLESIIQNIPMDITNALQRMTEEKRICHSEIYLIQSLITALQPSFT